MAREIRKRGWGPDQGALKLFFSTLWSIALENQYFHALLPTSEKRKRDEHGGFLTVPQLLYPTELLALLIGGLSWVLLLPLS
jgi:hypothetical protein